MCKEDYVSFETAKLLKEKGFNLLCSACYDRFHVDDVNDGLNPTDFNNMDTRRKDIVSAPTQQMAMKWLREVHKLHINLDIHWLYFANALGWMYTIEKILENGVDYVSSRGDENDETAYACIYSSYEEACEAAIKYCLEHLI